MWVLSSFSGPAHRPEANVIQIQFFFFYLILYCCLSIYLTFASLKCDKRHNYKPEEEEEEELTNTDKSSSGHSKIMNVCVSQPLHHK